MWGNIHPSPGALVWARMTVWAVMLAHVVTPLERVLGLRDPITGTEQIGHIVTIVQDSQAGLGISMENTAFSQPVYNRSNVLDGLRVSTWNIQKNREEATSLRSLMGDEFTEVPARSIECDQLRVPRTNHCLICDLRNPCAAG